MLSSMKPTWINKLLTFLLQKNLYMCSKVYLCKHEYTCIYIATTVKTVNISFHV